MVLVLGAVASWWIALSSIPTVCAAPFEGIAGWEADGFGQGYGFLTFGTFAGEGGRLSVPIRITASYLYYDYRAGGTDVSVQAPGTSGSLGLRAAPGWGGFTVLVGSELRWERREREGVSGAPAAVARGGIVVQGELDAAPSRQLRPSLLASYSGSSRYIYGRALLRWQCSNLDWRGPTTWFLGIEGIGQGNQDTEAAQAGGTLDCTIVPAHLTVGIHGGYKRSESSNAPRREGLYAGAGIYRKF